MIFVDPYTPKEDIISSLEHWIIVHSFIYYKFNTNLVSDYMYDMDCKQLAEYIETYPEAAAKSRYYYVFKDFDGSTGEYLIYGLNQDDYIHVMDKVEYLLQTFGDN